MAASNSDQLEHDAGDEDRTPTRTGTLRTCVAHIITALIGSEVLCLAWSTSQLGWIAGTAALLIFGFINYLSAILLADYYWSNNGTRNKSYMDAVKLYLGGKRTWLCALLLNLSLSGTAISCIIKTSTSMSAIQKSNCNHREGHDVSFSCGDTSYMLLFGAMELVMSQIPYFSNMEWLSGVAAIMFFTFSFIGIGLGFAQVIENGEIQGSITGVPTANIADKIWLAFQALGKIALVYPYSIPLLEKKDTLMPSPQNNKTMKKASMISIFSTTLFYLCFGYFGYAAFGNDTPRNLLTEFGLYEPYWLIDFAHVCTVLHLVVKYQIISQPVFAFVEGWFTKKFLSSGFVNEFYTIKLPLIPSFKINLFKISFRTIYVASTITATMIFPYFDQVLGVLGAINFWPLTIYFPVEMYFVKMEIEPWTRRWIVLKSLSFVCLLVTIMIIIGSVQELISANFI